MRYKITSSNPGDRCIWCKSIIGASPCFKPACQAKQVNHLRQLVAAINAQRLAACQSDHERANALALAADHAAILAAS